MSGPLYTQRNHVSRAEMVFSEESVLITEPQPVISPTQTPPTPSRRINPPPERVKTHSYPPPELPPCGHILMSISAVSEQGVIYAMTHQAGVCRFILSRKNYFSSDHIFSDSITSDDWLRCIMFQTWY